jgi:hypothetical protein
MRLQIALSLLPRIVRSCAIVDQRRVRGLALRASRGQIFIAITRRVIAISPGTPGAFFSRQIATIFSRHRGLACLLVSRGNFHQFSPVRGLLLKLMLCRRNVSCTGVLLLI